MKLSLINGLLCFFLFAYVISHGPSTFKKATLQWKQVFLGETHELDTQYNFLQPNILDTLYEVFPGGSFEAKPNPHWLSEIEQTNDAIKIRMGYFTRRNVYCAGIWPHWKFDPVRNFPYIVYEFTTKGIIRRAQEDEEFRNRPAKSSTKLLKINSSKYQRLTREIDFSRFYTRKKPGIRRIKRNQKDHWASDFQSDACHYNSLWIEVEQSGKRKKMLAMDSGINQKILLDLLEMINETDRLTSEINHASWHEEGEPDGRTVW